MDRRELLKSLAALGVAVPAAAIAASATRKVIDDAMRTLDRTDWWVPVLAAWKDGCPSPELDAFCDALAVPHGTECARIDVAVARLLLGSIQDELPMWASLGEDGWVTARPAFPRRLDGTPRFEPELAIEVNWATSGPGFEWPEAWYVTTIPELGIHVVTASRDSEDAFGCTDHAIGWRPISIDDYTAACELIQADWQRRRDQYDQDQWEDLRDGGFLADEVVAEIAAEVWADDQEPIDDEA